MVIKLATITNTYNIAATDSTVMVPVLSENGSLIAYLLSADPTGISQGTVLLQRVPREYHCNTAIIKMLLAVPVSRLFTHQKLKQWRSMAGYLAVADSVMGAVSPTAALNEDG